MREKVQLLSWGEGEIARLLVKPSRMAETPKCRNDEDRQRHRRASLHRVNMMGRVIRS